MIIPSGFRFGGEGGASLTNLELDMLQIKSGYEVPLDIPDAQVLISITLSHAESIQIKVWI